MRTAIAALLLGVLALCSATGLPGYALAHTATDGATDSVIRGTATRDLAPLPGVQIELINTRTGEVLRTYSSPGGSFQLDTAGLSQGCLGTDIVKVVASPVTEGKLSPTLTVTTTMNSNVREVDFRLRTPPRDQTYEFWVGDASCEIGSPSGVAADAYVFAPAVFANVGSQNVDFYGNTYFRDNQNLGRTCEANYGLAASGNVDPTDIDAWQSYTQDGSTRTWDVDHSIVFSPGSPQIQAYWYSADIYSRWRYQLVPGGNWSTWASGEVHWNGNVPVYNHFGLEEVVVLSWEFGQSVLGTYGNVAYAANVTGMQIGQAGAGEPYECPGARHASCYLNAAEEPHSGTPQIFLAWVQNLADGDVITAGFHGYDVTPTVFPSMRIWGHYADSYDVGSYYGSAGGNYTYTAGTGWDYVGHTWTFDSSGGAADALIIEARLYSTPASGEFRTDFFIDLVTVSAPPTATVLFPEPGTGIDDEETSWSRIKSIYR
jgi:hypothetical protein